jgi:hypothetical protein
VRALFGPRAVIPSLGLGVLGGRLGEWISRMYLFLFQHDLISQLLVLLNPYVAVNSPMAGQARHARCTALSPRPGKMLTRQARPGQDKAKPQCSLALAHSPTRSLAHLVRSLSRGMRNAHGAPRCCYCCYPGIAL